MEKIVGILMRRDGISEEEAWELVERCKEEIKNGIDNQWGIADAEESIKYWLGLEPDYLLDLLEF